MSDAWPPVVLDLPEWVEDEVAPDRVEESVEGRMALVVALARRNVAEQSGGPFAAAIFERDSGRLVAPGVNRVVPTAVPFAHAEILAIGSASRLTGTFDLGSSELPPMELVASTEPCALCLGATVWSGVVSVITGARDADARSIGFDEGPKVADWVGALNQRGIEVTTDVMRAEAAAVLNEYAAAGNVIYNGRHDA